MTLVLAGRGGGGGKGGGSATTGRVPVEDPNTLRSRATARVVDLVSEGPVVGLVDGAKSIFFDDTPLQNEDGSFNFQNVAWSTRSGEPDQEPIPGFADVEATVAVGIEVTQAAPVTRTLSDPDLDAVRIILRIPALTRQDTATGDIRATSVRIAIDVQPDGGGFAEVVDDTVTGKTVSPYERAYRVALPPGGAPWTVRMRRITPDSDAATVTDKTFFAAYVTIVDNRLVYPDSALVAPAVDAQAFGGRVPARAYEMDLLILDVPSNYDAIARSYDGDWDGTFQQSWTNNPAWVLYGLLTNPRWGLGLDQDAVDKWELYRIAQYCDEAVEDGLGGEEPRFTFNYVVNHAEDAYALVQAVASSFRGIVYWAAGTVVVTADMPEDPVALAAPANVVDGRFDYAGSGLKARHTVALVTWFDPEDGYRPAPEIVEDAEGIERFGAREAHVVAIGCTSRGQAARAGRWLLDSEKHETETVTYRAAWDHAQLRPGNIVAVADPAYAGVRFGGRLAGFDAGTSTATLDAPVVLGAGESYTLSLVQADGTLFDAAVTSPAGETATLTLADVPVEAPVPGAMWVLTGSDVAPRLFRVVAVREVEAHLYEVTALVHDLGKYDRIEQGLVLDPPSFTALPTGRLVPPTGISAIEYLYRIGPGLRSAVTVSWTASPDPRMILYELQARPPEAEYRPAGTSVTTSVDLLDVAEGVWAFRVRGLDAAGRPSPWAELPGFLVASVAGTPADVTGFGATVIDDMATLAWDESSDLRVVHYRIRYSPQTDGASWGSAVVLVDRIAATSVQVPATAGSWLIKAVGPTGKESANAALIVSTVALVQGLNVVELVEEAPAFAGDMDGVEAADGALRLEEGDGAFPPDGVYGFAGAVDLGSVYTSRLTAGLSAYGEDIANVMASWPTLANVETLSGADPSSWSVAIEMQATADDPEDAEAAWSDWRRLVIGDHTARAFRFRAVLATALPTVTPVVEALSVEIDMPDRVVAGDDLLVPEEGLAVAFDPPFLALAGIGIGAQDLATGDRWAITDKGAAGFTIRFFDAGGTPVARTTDYVAKGHGRLVAGA
ncbi:MAG: host specificity protein J [Alphaproteobacteria bacterium]